MASRRVVVVTIPAAQILDVAGPIEVFSSATALVPGVDYRTELVSATGGMVPTSCGVALETSPMAEVAGPIDTLVVAGGRDTAVVAEDPELLDQVRRLAEQTRRVTSVCSGAFVLAGARLLDGRRATTHWAEAGDLGERHPDVEVDADAIFVRDGDVWTSAGVTAGIDLALALVADDHGQEAAAAVARHLVVYLRRSGGQTQYSALLATQAAQTEPMRDLLAWIVDHLAEDLSVAALAERMHLSPRQFARVFKDEVGVTPADHVESVRVDAACRLLETTGDDAQQIARTCGFGTIETMHRVFRRRLDTTPGQHRRHFHATTSEP
jgi:transcriptional regulator GlxA family with amidase domain